MKYFIFDVDGTLLDSDRTIVRCMVDSAKKLGYSVSQVRENIGIKKLEDILEFNGVPPSIIPVIIDEYKVCYETTFKLDTFPINGSYEVLKTLSQKNKLGIITFKYWKLTNLLIDEFFNGIEFQYKFCGDYPFPIKDKAEALNLISTEVGDPRNVIYIGDRLNDMIAARKSGVIAVWAAYGLGKMDKNIQYDFMISDISDLLDIDF